MLNPLRLCHFLTANGHARYRREHELCICVFLAIASRSPTLFQVITIGAIVLALYVS